MAAPMRKRESLVLQRWRPKRSIWRIRQQYPLLLTGDLRVALGVYAASYFAGAADCLNRGDRLDQRPCAARGGRRDWEWARRSFSVTASRVVMPYVASSAALRNLTRSGGINIMASMIVRGTFICCA